MARKRKNPVSFDQMSDMVQDTVERRAGRAMGGMMEKMILGNRQSKGRVRFSQTPEGKKREYLKSHKGYGARMMD